VLTLRAELCAEDDANTMGMSEGRDAARTVQLQELLGEPRVYGAAAEWERKLQRIAKLFPPVRAGIRGQMLALAKLHISSSGEGSREGLGN
jgi:hypothetical protein